MNDGFLNLNKAAGMTSHDAVNLVRKIWGTKKVVRVTKFIEYISNFDKTYRAEINLNELNFENE